MDVKNKVILITGGSSGIGKAAALELAKEGATIILQARSIEKLKAAAAEIALINEKVSYYATDLTDSNSVKEAASRIVEEVCLPDIVINCAGSGEWLSLGESSAEHYKDTMDSPYLATAFTCKVFYDKMRDRKHGHFIIINSAASYFSFPGATGYTPARWAMLGLARSLQADLYYTDFNVSIIALGKVDSPYFTSNPVSEDRIPKIANWLIPTMSLKASGKVIARAVQTQKKIIIKPFSLRVLVFLNIFMPATFRWLMRITGHKQQS